MKSDSFTLALPILLVFFVTACGGGGGGGTSPPPAPPPAPPPPPVATDPLGEVGTKEEEQDRLFEAIGEDVIAPAYAELDDKAEALEQAVENFCNAPTEDHGSLEDAWREAMLAWQEIQHVAVGPIESENRRYRLQWYPDRSDTVRKEVDDALSESDPLTEQVIAGRPVGIQGLPALEYLFFEVGGLHSADRGPRRCELARAVAANVSTIAGEVADPWLENGAYVEDFVNATGDDFTERDDVLIAILEALGVQAEFIGDQKLKPAIDGSNAESLESHYAAHSAENISANIGGLDALFEAEADDAYRLRDYMERVHEADSITERLDTELTAAADHIDGFEGSLEDVVTGMVSGAADSLYDAVQEIADLAVETAAEAGVQLGFNNQDGD